MPKKAAAKVEPPTTDKLGEFEIGIDIINEAPQLVKRIMSECIVMRAEYMFATKSVVYQAIHEDFEDRTLGEYPPTYEPEYDEASDALNWSKQD